MDTEEGVERNAQGKIKQKVWSFALFTNTGGNIWRFRRRNVFALIFCAFPICSCIEGLDTLYIIVPRLLGVFHVINYDQKLSVIEG